MNRHSMRTLSCVLIAACLPAVASAAPYFTDTFDVDHSANWAYNSSISGDTSATADNGGAADAFFDYSTVGIPAAPGGTSTRGLKVQANLPNTGVLSGISVSPIGLTLPNEYILKFHMWENTIGPFPAGGSGSTQLSSASVGVSGTSSEFAGATMTGVQFSATSDGASSVDYRAYTAQMPHGAGGVLTPADGVYAAGTGATANNNTDPYYASFSDGTNVAPPLDQKNGTVNGGPVVNTPYPNQTGNLAAGGQAFAWRLWTIVKTADSITWSIDGKVISTVPSSFFPTAFGNNIAFGQADINATSSTEANSVPLEFGLIDNVVVDAVPEPTTLSLLGLGALGLVARRRRSVQ